MKTLPSVTLLHLGKASEQLFVATESNVKLRYKGYKKLSGRLS